MTYLLVEVEELKRTAKSMSHSTLDYLLEVAAIELKNTSAPREASSRLNTPV